MRKEAVLRRLFYLGKHQFQFFRWNELHADGEPLQFEELPVALDFVRCLMGDPYESGKLQSLAVEHGYSAALAGEVNHSFLAQLARDILHGRILVLREPRVYYAGLEDREEQPKTEKPKDAPPPSTERKKKTDWIEFRVVWGDTGQPVQNVRLTVTQPDGNRAYHTTNAGGVVRIEGLDPGTCDVTCRRQDPRFGNTLDFVRMDEGAPTSGEEAGETPKRSGIQFIAKIEEHKVKSGENLKSLAESAGLTWQQLAVFNWNTAVPEEINEHLCAEVGCTKKTSDGNNYVFDDADDPGIVLIPHRWEKKGLATGERHVIQVDEVSVTRELIDVLVRVDHDPDLPESWDDTCRLFTTGDVGGTYDRTVAMTDEALTFREGATIAVLFREVYAGRKYSCFLDLGQNASGHAEGGFLVFHDLEVTKDMGVEGLSEN